MIRVHQRLSFFFLCRYPTCLFKVVQQFYLFDISFQGIGLTLQEALHFWQTEFTRIMDLERVGPIVKCCRKQNTDLSYC